jgi:hypothetical protein
MNHLKRSFVGKLIPTFVWKRVLLLLLGNDRAKQAIMLKALEDRNIQSPSGNAIIDLDALTPHNPRQVHVVPDGVIYVDFQGARYIEDNGMEHTVTRNGELTLKLPGTTRVQINDVALLLGHTSVRLHQTTSHTMTFRYDGVLSYMVDDAKTMMEAHVKNLCVTTSEAGVLKVLGCTADSDNHAAHKRINTK